MIKNFERGVLNACVMIKVILLVIEAILQRNHFHISTTSSSLKRFLRAHDYRHGFWDQDLTYV